MLHWSNKKKHIFSTVRFLMSVYVGDAYFKPVFLKQKQHIHSRFLPPPPSEQGACTWSAIKTRHGKRITLHLTYSQLFHEIVFLRSTAAQLNLGKLLLRRSQMHSKGVPRNARESGEDVREAKRWLCQVIGNNREHPGANICLARVFAEEGGARGVSVKCLKMIMVSPGDGSLHFFIFAMQMDFDFDCFFAGSCIPLVEVTLYSMKSSIASAGLCCMNVQICFALKRSSYSDSPPPPLPHPLPPLLPPPPGHLPRH